MTDVRTGLRCATESLDGEPVDLIAFAGPDGFVFEQEGHGLAGRGEALRIGLPRGLAGDVSVVADVLANIEGDGVPLALGALPFDRDEPTSLVVPAEVVRRDSDGRQWRTTVGDPGVAPAPGAGSRAA